MSKRKQVPPKILKKDAIKLPLDKVALMILYIYWAYSDEDIGNQHALLTVDEIVKQLRGQQEIWVAKDRVEDAMWAAGMLEEKGKFWHPYTKTFKGFIRSVLPDKYKLDPSQFQIMRRSKNEHH